MFPDLRGDPGRDHRLPARFARLTPAAAVTSGSHRPRLVNGEVPSAEFAPVQLRDGATCAVIVVHLDERESSRLPRGTVADNADRGDAAGTLEQGLKIGLAGFVRKIADVKFATHELLLHLEDATRSDCRLERDARRRHAGEPRNSNLVREAGMLSGQKALTV